VSGGFLQAVWQAAAAATVDCCDAIAACRGMLKRALGAWSRGYVLELLFWPHVEGRRHKQQRVVSLGGSMDGRGGGEGVEFSICCAF